MRLWILDSQDKPVQADLMTWANWFETANRVVKQESIGDSHVSTVFLGVDHNFGIEGPPILWETLVFNGKMDQEMDRCAGNREQAEAMHEEMVQRVRETEGIRIQP